MTNILICGLLAALLATGTACGVAHYSTEETPETGVATGNRGAESPESGATAR